MDKYTILKRLQKMYRDDVNIIQYLNSLDRKDNNSIEDIMISYDFQAGSYVKHYFDNNEFIEKYTNKLARVIEDLNVGAVSIFEGGVGEATTLVPLINKLKGGYSFIGGNDISWSRIATARKFAQQYCRLPVNLVVGNLFELPLADDSIDIVYTSHSLEPNGGHEKELLEELYRVTKKYLILLEPAYELASNEAKERMKKHGYVMGLFDAAKNLGYEIERYELFGISSNSLNPTGLMIIKKKRVSMENVNDCCYCCPITKTRLDMIGNAWFSGQALLAYPTINGVPCLVRESAVIATQLEIFDNNK